MGDPNRDDTVDLHGQTPRTAPRSAEPRVGATITVDGPAPAPQGPSAFASDWSDAGRYALISEIARGGGGRIALAVDRKLGRKVALKRALDEDGEQRLEREALVLARLEHPAIVPIHDAGFDGEGAPFYTMKLVPGHNLAQRIDATRTFEQRLALLPVVTTVADAMAYAHGQRVIHRDLKPGNVLVGEFGEVAVIDWGLGKVIGDSEPAGRITPLPGAQLTQHGAVIGTPAYMAPEQAEAGIVDERADVYAIGAMVYHVLAGEVPYGNIDTEQTLARLLSGPPPAIDEREPRVPRELAAIIGKAMARVASERYPTAKELAEDLHRYQTGRLVAAHRYRAWTRTWRWLRRHQVRVAVATAAAAIGVAAVAIVVMNGRASAELCADVDAPARAAWNPVIAAPIGRAFEASDVPHAKAIWRTVVAELDGRAGRIAEMRISACRAARISGEQSMDTLDRRMTCLDRRTEELRNVVGWLGQAERAIVEHAGDGVAALGRVDDCADVTRLHDVVALPADPMRRAAIFAVDGEVDRALMTMRAGSFTVIDRTLPPIIDRARATGYEPLVSRALFARAQSLLLQTKTEETLRLADQALVAAERAGDDRRRADILLLRLHVELNTLQHTEVAAGLVRQVQAIGDRVHDPSILASALGYQSQIDHETDHMDDAIRHAEQALALIAAPDSRDGWTAQFRLGSIYAAAHRLDDAKRILEHLVASRRAVIGDADDPAAAADLTNLAAVYDAREDVPLAIATMKHAVGIYDRTLPADAKARMGAHANLAVLLSKAGHREEARAELVALLPIAEGKLGHDHKLVADIAFRIAETEEHLHHLDAALAGYRDALARYTGAKSQLWIAKCHGHIGTVLLEATRPAEALPELQSALAAISELRGPDSPEAATWRGDVGRVYLVLGDARHAIAELERALATLDHGTDLVERGMYRMNLAMAHWQLGDRDGARALAKQARAALEQAGAEGADNLADLTAWEREHP